MRLLCIVNPAAGTRRDTKRITEPLRHLAGSHGWDLTSALTEGPSQAIDIARDAAGRYDVVVAVGGDGTIHEVATGLVGGSAALGIVPAGSGNGLARSLGVPIDARRAVAALETCEFRALDVGEVNGRLFFAVAGIGLDAVIARRFHETGKIVRGLIPYIVHAVSTWTSHQPELLSYSIDGRHFEERLLTLVVANVEQYGFNTYIAPGARPDDGEFLVTRVAPLRGLALPRAVVQLFRGTLGKNAAVQLTPGETVTVERAAPGLIQLDGEAIEAEARLQFTIRPGALRVWIPPAG